LLAILGKAREHRLRDWVMLLFLFWHGLRVSELVRSSSRQAGLFFTREKAHERIQQLGDGAAVQEVKRRIKGKPRMCYLVTTALAIARPGMTFGAVTSGEVTVRRLKRSLKTTQGIEEHENPLLNEKLAWEEWLSQAPLLGKKGAAAAGNHRGKRPSAEMQQNEILLHFAPNERVFGISRSQLFRIWQRYATEAGLPPRKRHPHCAKHTLGTLLSDAGVPLPQIQIRLGHADLGSTGKYTLPKEDDVSRAVGKAIRGLSAG
jgi:site-specific recombinase XerD